MRLTIFGATGGTDPARLALPAHQRLRILTADVMNPAAIQPAVADADAVLSAVGPRGGGPTWVCQDSARSIITAMQTCGAHRLLAITGSMVTDVGDGPITRFVGKPLTRRLLRHTCADFRHAEDEIHASHLEWTILRPPSLTNKAASGAYRTAIDRNVRRGLTIARADLAAHMLTLLDDTTTVHKHVCIAN
jgi:putative NADH-flavin reductase